MNDVWPALERSLLMRNQLIHGQMIWLRASAAVATARDEGEPRERALLLRSAERDARTLRKSHVLGFPAIGTLTFAGVAAIRGDLDRARVLLADAVREFAAAEMALWAAVARHRLGELTSGDEGRALIAEARGFMDGEAIKNPRRMLQLYAPGFADPSGER